MAEVDFFFDFISPYTYVARTQLDALAERTGARFKTWPMHLLNLMKIVGNTPTTVVCKNKRKYAGQDLARWCARYHVPLKLNPHLQGDHSLTLKGALVAQEMNLEDQYNRAIFSAFWTDAVNVTDRSALVQHLESAGLDGTAILIKAEEPEYAEHMESNTQIAADRGVFGSPTFIVGDDMFFGNDRLDFLEARLKKSAS
ncbi:MAG: 2-hydroxychromene-2-carboxylate isomerase [Candidatus Binataceae bacterium]